MGECAAIPRRGGKPTIGSVRSAGKIARGDYALAREAVDVAGTLFAREAATRAGNSIMALARHRSFELRGKSGVEIVTSADRISDGIIR